MTSCFAITTVHVIFMGGIYVEQLWIDKTVRNKICSQTIDAVCVWLSKNSSWHNVEACHTANNACMSCWFAWKMSPSGWMIQTWFHYNPREDKQLHPLKKCGWNPVSFPNVNGATVEVCELICNFFPCFTRHVITYPWWDLGYSM